jgi:hypothetical protein
MEYGDGYTARTIRGDDFVAELIEKIAARIPPEFRWQADPLRAEAQKYRMSTRTGLCRVWEPCATKSLVKSDSAPSTPSLANLAGDDCRGASEDGDGWLKALAGATGLTPPR